VIAAAGPYESMARTFLSEFAALAPVFRAKVGEAFAGLQAVGRPDRLRRLSPDLVRITRGDMIAALRISRLIEQEADRGHELTAACVAAAVRGDAEALDAFRDRAEAGDALALSVVNIVDALDRLAAGNPEQAAVLRFLLLGALIRPTLAPDFRPDAAPPVRVVDAVALVAPINGPNVPALTCSLGHVWAAAA